MSLALRCRLWVHRRLRPILNGSWTLSGDAHLVEHRFFGVRVFVETRVQKWAPLMTEWAIERGFYIGVNRFSYTRQFKEFHDGKAPRYVKGRY